MITLISDDIKKTFEKYAVFSKKILWLAASHAFLSTMVLVAAGAAIGGILFYIYVVAVQNQAIEVPQSPAVFQESLYRAVLDSWQIREAAIENSAQEVYNNPFK